MLQLFDPLYQRFFSGFWRTLITRVDVKLKMYKFDEIKMLNFV